MTTPEEQLKQFLDNVAATIEQAVNPDGSKRGAYAVFIFDSEKPDGNSIFLSNLDTAKALETIVPAIEELKEKVKPEEKPRLHLVQ